MPCGRPVCARLADLHQPACLCPVCACAAVPAASHHQPPSVQLPSGAVALIEAGRASPESALSAQPPAAAGAPRNDTGALQAQEQAPGAAAVASGADAGAGADVHQAEAAAVLDPAGAAAAGDEEGAGRAVGAAGALGRLFTVAGAELVSGDMVGGKAVLHVVDRVLISPGLSRELGLMPSPGYNLLDTPQPTAASTSGVSGMSAAGFAGWALPMAVAVALCLL